MPSTTVIVGAHAYTVDPSAATVGDLKRLHEGRSGIPAALQRLSFPGASAPASPSVPLSQCGILSAPAAVNVVGLRLEVLGGGKKGKKKGGKNKDESKMDDKKKRQEKKQNKKSKKNAKKVKVTAPACDHAWMTCMDDCPQTSPNPNPPC
jgi:hypothetical protein